VPVRATPRPSLKISQPDPNARQRAPRLYIGCTEFLGRELGVSVQILTRSLSHSVAWIARLIAPKRLQFLQRLVRGRVRPIGGHVCRYKLDDEQLVEPGL
jgi:hypothetical protein